MMRPGQRRRLEALERRPARSRSTPRHPSTDPPPELRHDLHALFDELVTNAIEHGWRIPTPPACVADHDDPSCCPRCARWLADVETLIDTPPGAPLWDDHCDAIFQRTGWPMTPHARDTLRARLDATNPHLPAPERIYLAMHYLLYPHGEIAEQLSDLATQTAQCSE